MAKITTMVMTQRVAKEATSINYVYRVEVSERKGNVEEDRMRDNSDEVGSSVGQFTP